MKHLITVISLIAASIPVQAETIYLLIKSEMDMSGSALALHSIPMESLEQCEEMGAFIIASERLDTKYAKRDGFECLEGK